MKKLTCLLIVVMLCCFVCSATASGDLFYVDSSSGEIADAIKNINPSNVRNIKNYLQNYYLATGETFEEERLTVKYEELYGERTWSVEETVEFLKTEDKANYLDGMEYINYCCPIYYDGVLLKEYMTIFTYNEQENKYKTIATGDPVDQRRVLYTNKELLLELLEENGLTGYELIQSVNVESVRFLIVQKDGELFMVHIPYEADSRNYIYYSLHDQQQTLLDKKIFTMEESQILLNCIGELKEEVEAQQIENSGQLVGGQVETTEESNDRPEVPWSILVVVGLVGAITVTILVLRKRV